MNGKITDIGWYTSSRNEPISKGGRSEQFNRYRPVKTSYLGRPTDPMATLYGFIEAFRLRGIEFGNWITQDERRAFVPALNTTLNELGAIMHTSNIGFDHNIGIALGARGRRGALAHYEPVLNMINLTRKKGEGCLAHEYAHALDYNFGAFIDQNARYNALSGGHNADPTLPLNTGGQLRALVNNIVDSICNGENYPALRRYDAKREVPYWTRRTEIFARFFEQYIAYLYKQKGQTNRILCQPYDSYIAGKVYVAHEDFLRIKPVADQLMQEFSRFLCNQGTLRTTPYPAKLAIAPAATDSVAGMPTTPISYRQYVAMRQDIATAGCFDTAYWVFFVPRDDKYKKIQGVYVVYGNPALELSKQRTLGGHTDFVIYKYTSRPNSKSKIANTTRIPAFYCDEQRLHALCVHSKQTIVLQNGSQHIDTWHPSDTKKPAATKGTKAKS